MNTISKNLTEFGNNIIKFHIPRWEELPDIELYMDQVITFIENNISIVAVNNEERIITPSMVNNYVKLNLIPKPIKKRYGKAHLAYLIAITILKHVFTIQEVKDGISFQALLNGEKDAYNLFCEEQESALKLIASQVLPDSNPIISNRNVNPENLVIKMATLAFASKILGEKTIKLQKNLMDLEKENNPI